MNKKIKQKIGYQGISGAYSEMAAESFVKKSSLKNTEYIGYKSFDEIFANVENAHLLYGVVPVENSLAGSIHRNFDLLGKHNLKVIGEVYVHVNHQLLGLKNAKISDIRQIYSHPQALMQCEHNVKDFLPLATMVEHFDTAGSAEYVAKQADKSKASLASIKAGQAYGLKVLKKDFQDDKDNYTRFLVIAREYANFKNLNKLNSDKNKFKTSIIFTTENISGSLFKSLSCFALRDINLNKIESRPIPKNPWKNQFYLDFEGKYNDEIIISALNNLKDYASEIKILGSYFNFFK